MNKNTTSSFGKWIPRLIAVAGVGLAVAGTGGCKSIAKEAAKRAVKEANKPTEGKACSNSMHAACVDDKNMLKCDGSKFVKVPCRGKSGCEKSNRKIFCDHDHGKEGDNCVARGALSCTDDDKALLECKRGKFVKDVDCLGENGCEQDHHKIYCDSSIAVEGAKCSHVSAPACSKDGKTLLRCARGKWTKQKTCGKCSVDHKPNHRFLVKCGK